MNRPIIQGGMGIYISTPFLARICSQHENVLGTESCVAAEKIMCRILQSGDLGGHFRRALGHFPFLEVSDRILKEYFVEGGIAKEQKFKIVPAFSVSPRPDLIELTVAANFAFVWLAKEGHSNPVSVNYLEKMQIPHIYSITGAMLAGVDIVTMGAGITLQIPGVLDALSKGEPAIYNISVDGSKSGSHKISFEPRNFFGSKFPDLVRPDFLPIVSTDVLASFMAKRLPKGSIQGFVVELPTAGGHNAPPREKGTFNEWGEPLYGPRDQVSFDKLRGLGIPFWLGGSVASPEGLLRAQSLGAEGIQAGSIFALCEDSGMDPTLRKEMRRLGYRGELVVRTDPNASPTGFPFKVAQLDGTLSSPKIFQDRKRICDLGGLLVPYQMEDETIGYRCEAEPEKSYTRKGGKEGSGVSARCLCNGLLSTVGLGNPNEPPIVTIGDDVSFLRHLMRDENDTYTAEDAIRYLLLKKS